MIPVKVNSSRALNGGASCFSFMVVDHRPLAPRPFCRNFRYVLHSMDLPEQRSKVKPFDQLVTSFHRRIDAKFGCSLRTFKPKPVVSSRLISRYLRLAESVIRAKDSAFIPTLKDGDFSVRPSQSYELKVRGEGQYPYLALLSPDGR